MALLNGALAATFARAFGPLYLDGTLHGAAMVDDGAGGWTPGAAADVAIKVQTDACTEAMRQAAGYTATDVRLLILANGIGKPSTDARVTDGWGVTYRLADVTTDPARAYYEARGIKVGG